MSTTTYRRLTVFVTVLLSLASTCWAQYEGAAIRAPVVCANAPSCGAGLSLEDAKKSYDENRHLLSPQRKATPIVKRHICKSPKTLDPYYFWAPSEEVISGPDVVNELKSYLRTGSSLDGHIYVEAAESRAGERYVALCQVAHVGRAVGPPLKCATVAIFTFPSGVWLRVQKENDSRCPSIASMRSSGAIDIEFELETKSKPIDLVPSLRTVLEKTFGLSVETEQDGGAFVRLKSAASLRDSKILPPGWRETLTFDVIIRQGQHGLFVSGTAFPMVCRQALGYQTDYTGLDDAQQGMYSEALDAGIDDGIKQHCKHYRKKDSKRISCD